MQKTDLRRFMLTKRNALLQSVKIDDRLYHCMIKKLRTTFLLPLYGETPPQQITVAGYYPVGSELNVIPLLQRLFGYHYTVCLPVVQHPHTFETPLTFWEWVPGTATELGKYNIPIPRRDQSIAVRRPDIILTPLIAYDSDGRRLGQGGGYYDRTLAQYQRFKKGTRDVVRLKSRNLNPVLVCGIAYDQQFCPQLASVSEPHDALLDAVLTEKQFYVCNRALDSYLFNVREPEEEEH